MELESRNNWIQNVKRNLRITIYRNEDSLLRSRKMESLIVEQRQVENHTVE